MDSLYTSLETSGRDPASPLVWGGFKRDSETLLVCLKFCTSEHGTEVSDISILLLTVTGQVVQPCTTSAINLSPLFLVIPPKSTHMVGSLCEIAKESRNFLPDNSSFRVHIRTLRNPQGLAAAGCSSVTEMY